jgi:hypothetical protein
MARFADAKQQAVYDRHLATPPERGSGGLATAYYRGLEAAFNWPLASPPYARTSLAYAAWRAGRKRQLMNRGRS